MDRDVVRKINACIMIQKTFRGFLARQIYH